MKICMLAYANYLTDGRIRNYVGSLENRAADTDIIVLKEGTKSTSEHLLHGHIYYLCKKYRGDQPFKYIFNYLWFFLCSFLKLSFLHMKNKYDVVHVHNMPNFLVFAALVPKILSARIVLDVHDIMTAIAMAKFSCNENRWIIKLLRLEQRLSAAFADRVICADHLQRNVLKEYGIPEEKISVIMNVVNSRVVKHSSNRTKNAKFNLIYHGTIAKRLGIDLLLKAVATIRDQIPVFLNVYGEGDFLEECLALKHELALGEVVYFSKSLFPYVAVPGIISNMDVGIIPSRYSIAANKFMLPAKLMEYTYFQIPVIAPRLDIIQYYFDEEMIRFYEPENIEDLANCILDLFENPEKRFSLIEKANKFIEKYKWEIQEKDYLELIGFEKQTVCAV